MIAALEFEGDRDGGSGGRGGRGGQQSRLCPTSDTHHDLVKEAANKRLLVSFIEDGEWTREVGLCRQ